MKDTVKSVEASWDLVIEPRSQLFQLNLQEVWRYKYLLAMFVKRDLVSIYKQTILGPTLVFHSANTSLPLHL
jgi:lipopolysaccharide transport system permease protein